MPKEIELTVYGIEREKAIKKLEECKAIFVGKYHFKTVNFQLETKGNIKSLEASKEDEQYYTAWLRVRTDGKRTTLTFKEQYGTTILKRSEYEVEVSDFLKTVKIIMKLLPNAQYNYTESEREEYKLGEVTIDINKRPYLLYSIEIEGPTHEVVMETYKKLGIRKEPMKSIAVPDEEFYKLFGVDYKMVSKEYKEKLEKMLAELDKI